MAAPEASSTPARAPGPWQPMRPRWTPYLQTVFALTVHALGGPFEATPHVVLKVMSVAGGAEGVTVGQVRYHLRVCPRNTNVLRTNSPMPEKVQLSVCCGMAPPEAVHDLVCGSRLRAMPLLARQGMPVGSWREQRRGAAPARCPWCTRAAEPRQRSCWILAAAAAREPAAAAAAAVSAAAAAAATAGASSTGAPDAAAPRRPRQCSAPCGSLGRALPCAAGACAACERAGAGACSGVRPALKSGANTQLPARQQRPGRCSGAGPTAAVRAQACANCGSVNEQWLGNPDAAVGGRVCYLCWRYYHDHGCPRPRMLYERLPPVPRLTAAEAAEMARLLLPPRAVRGSGAPWHSGAAALRCRRGRAACERAGAGACSGVRPALQAVAAAPCQHAAACAPAAARALLRRRADRRRARAGVCQLREQRPQGKVLGEQPGQGCWRLCLLQLRGLLPQDRPPAATQVLRAPAAPAAAHSSRGCCDGAPVTATPRRPRQWCTLALEGGDALHCRSRRAACERAGSGACGGVSSALKAVAAAPCRHAAVCAPAAARALHRRRADRRRARADVFKLWER